MRHGRGRLPSERERLARCVALDLVAVERSESAIVYPFMAVRMEVAALHVVLVALAHQVGEGVTTSAVRRDLAALAAPAP